MFFLTVLQVFTMFCKCLKLFSTVLQGFVCPFYYFAKINGCQCDNAPQEESLTIQVLTTVFPLFYKCLHMFFFVLQVFTIVVFSLFLHCFASVYNGLHVITTVFPLFYKSLQLFFIVLQVFTMFYK